MTIHRYIVPGLCLLLSGCSTLKTDSPPSAYTITDELMITVEPEEDHRICFVMEHQVQRQEKGEPELHGRKNAFSITVEPSVWAQVKREDGVARYSAETECLMGDELVRVSGQPGENFSVKIEPLAMDRFQVSGIYLAARYSASGELSKTIPFDFIATPGEPTLIYRKTVVFDPEAPAGADQLTGK
ncbi:hypothetical protein [Pontiella sp.]|uniref:hypothetical protein n=1 Tax=Pontiella sp. TaxID=2837462 RepID=UPI00356455B1